MGADLAPLCTQWRSGRLCSTTGQSRLACVRSPPSCGPRADPHRSPQELTYIIKQDIAHLNQQIAALQSFTRSNLNSASGSKQVSEHNNNVVMMLQSKLADTSIGFKDVLEIRTQVSASLDHPVRPR